MSDKLIRFKGTILEQGYGILSKLVMRDTKLGVGPKALYSYFTTWGDECFPGRALICHDLNINEKTFTNYLAELKKRGYVTVEQVKEGGRFSHNTYTIEYDLKKIMIIDRKIGIGEKKDGLPCVQKRNTIKENSHRVPQNGSLNFGIPELGTVIIPVVNNTNYKNTTNKCKVVDFSTMPLEEGTEKNLINEIVSSGINEKVV